MPMPTHPRRAGWPRAGRAAISAATPRGLLARANDRSLLAARRAHQQLTGRPGLRAGRRVDLCDVGSGAGGRTDGLRALGSSAAWSSCWCRGVLRQPAFSASRSVIRGRAASGASAGGRVSEAGRKHAPLLLGLAAESLAMPDGRPSSKQPVPAHSVHRLDEHSHQTPQALSIGRG